MTVKNESVADVLLCLRSHHCGAYGGVGMGDDVTPALSPIAQAIRQLEESYRFERLYLCAENGRRIEIVKGDGLWCRALARYKIDCLREIEIFLQHHA